MASTASFSQYKAVIIAMVGVSLPLNTGKWSTTFTTEGTEIKMINYIRILIVDIAVCKAIYRMIVHNNRMQLSVAVNL